LLYQYIKVLTTVNELLEMEQFIFTCRFHIKGVRGQLRAESELNGPQSRYGNFGERISPPPGGNRKGNSRFPFYNLVTTDTD
jgi:hypothetical protein